jgi:hypothetical protein
MHHRHGLKSQPRRNYWRHLNNDYREGYRAHRAAEVAIANAWWRRAYNASLTSLRVANSNLFGTTPKPDAKRERPFTFPPYDPTVAQVDNMKRLLHLILDEAEKPFRVDWLEVAELYREQGLLAQAEGALSRCNEDHQRVTKEVIQKLVTECAVGPVRYRR